MKEDPNLNVMFHQSFFFNYFEIICQKKCGNVFNYENYGQDKFLYSSIIKN